MAKKEKSLESTLWKACDKLRGTGIDRNDYRDALLSLIFLKITYDRFEKQRQELIDRGDEAFIEEPSFYEQDNVFFLVEESRWSYIINNASDKEIGGIVDTALRDLEEKNASLVGALPIGLYARLHDKMGSKFKGLLDEINKIPKESDEDKDIFGRVYEYFLLKFAIEEGEKAKGEFYTPRRIVQLIAELIEPYSGSIYDPCCGSGGMFVQSMKFIDAHKGNTKQVSVFGQEATPATYKLAKMNLAIRGISFDLGNEAASTFSKDKHSGLKADYIMANPPFNQSDWRSENELIGDNRWDGYVIPPVSNANYAWILQMLSHLNPNNGIGGFLLANGALGASGEEYKIRKQLILNHKVEAIIVLPREMFYSTDISVTLWIINNNKKEKRMDISHYIRDDKGNILDTVHEQRFLRNRDNEILFMDLRRKGEKYEKSFIQLSEKDIETAKNTFFAWRGKDKQYTNLDGVTYNYKNIDEYCQSVNIDELNDFSLVPSKYIKFVDHDLKINYQKEMSRIQKEMKDLISEEKGTQEMLKEAFKGIGYSIDE
jgi:type I restriction enzyme M protein